MTISFDIMPLHPFTQADVWPILTGYETREIYQVEKTETDSLTRFDFRLVQLEQPFHDDFYNDFTAEEIQIWNHLLPQGYSFGAYQAGELVGLVVGEVWPDERRARVWEFHVRAECRRMGIGRADGVRAGPRPPGSPGTGDARNPEHQRQRHPFLPPYWLLSGSY
jgi:ribosomal protein S18 acetylase RimI-like enzyme